MLEKEIAIKDSNILILGATFKENTPDMRNSKVPIIMEELQKNGVNTFLYDPLIESFSAAPSKEFFDAILLAVPHQQFEHFNIDTFLKDKSKKIIFDLKSSQKGIAADAKL